MNDNVRVETLAVWSCPDCAFTFDAFHTDTETGGYSCPACAEIELRDRLQSMLSEQGPGRLASRPARRGVDL